MYFSLMANIILNISGNFCNIFVASIIFYAFLIFENSIINYYQAEIICESLLQVTPFLVCFA